MTKSNENEDFVKSAVEGFADFLSKNALTRLDKVEKEIVHLSKTIENLMAAMESIQVTVNVLISNLMKDTDDITSGYSGKTKL